VQLHTHTELYQLHMVLSFSQLVSSQFQMFTNTIVRWALLGSRSFFTLSGRQAKLSSNTTHIREQCYKARHWWVRSSRMHHHYGTAVLKATLTTVNRCYYFSLAMLQKLMHRVDFGPQPICCRHICCLSFFVYWHWTIATGKGMRGRSPLVVYLNGSVCAYL